MYPLLFEPIRIGTIEAKNRILMPSLGTLFSMDQKLNERHIRFYERRAEGGAGIIVAGPVGVDYIGSGAIALSIRDDSYIPDFRVLAARVHACGAKLMIQLFHGGRYTFSFMIEGKQPIAPSAVRSRYTGEEPREMSLEEIVQVQDAFAHAARRAREAGIDGVEIIGSAGYLISQFLSPVTNQRTDGYGGSFENRARFAVETIQKVRAAVGDDYTVTIRVAGNDFVRGGNTNEDSARFCQLFERAGVDGINVTGGWHEAFVSQLTMEVPRGGYAYLAGGIRNAVSVPVIASNRITDPWTAERILEDGMADMVALGRVLIADPDWPLKAREGRPEEIRPCVGCMQGCMDRIFTGQALCCLVNAEAGLEEEREIKPAERPKKVVVIGSGPGGMEAARVAAMAGHEVDLYEKAPRIGGQLAVAGAPPGRGEFLGLVDYYEAVLPRLGVRIHTGVEVDVGRIREMNPEALILAEGAEPVIPNIPGADRPFVISSWELLKDNPPLGKKVAVIGGGAVGMETAMQVARIGSINPEVLAFLMFHRAETDQRLHELVRKGTKEVTIFEMLPKAGQDVGKSSRWVWLNDLRERGVRIVTKAKVEAIEPDGIVYTVDGETKKERFDSVILAVGSRPKKTLSESLEQARIPFRSVGDCNIPRMIIDAVHEGYLAAVDL
jgi:2,4-dienoyl-CoA reductase-like NADH-dependent reductase (Old Yellow Enzyme family)/thioredoxin reductase